MKAIFYDQFGGPDQLRYGELPIPVPADDEVLVKIAAAGVNPIDRRLRNGELQAFFAREWPIVPGWDLAGTIVDVGAKVVGWKAGDEVVGLAFTWTLHHGTYAEFAPVKAASIARKPKGLSFTEAAALPLVSLTAWESLAEYANLRPGQSVLIQAGAGGVGSVAIPIAKHLGATVFTTAREANFDYLRARGADYLIDYTQTNYLNHILSRAPEGLDVVLESLGSEAAVREAIRLVKTGGTVVYLNNEPPDTPEIVERRITTKFLHHRPDGESLGRLMELYSHGNLPLPAIEVLPVEAAAEAHRRSEAGQTRGKLVLEIRAT